MNEGEASVEIIRLSYPLDLSFPLANGSLQAIAIGDFDGIHLGHQEVIGKTLDIKRKKGTPASIMTFHPHPREVLGLDKYTRCLTPMERKAEWFQRMGLDRLYVVKFDEEFSKVSPEGFVEEVLKPLRIDTVVVGFDFTFGHRGRGNARMLKELCEPGIDVCIVEPYCLRGEKVSSTKIREQLQDGNVEKVRQFLGRPYAISGTVARGNGRGRTLGFPTANLVPDGPYVIPAFGVYAVRIQLEERRFNGVMNIGSRPTFSGTDPTLEIHLFDFQEDIYGRQLKVEFFHYLRQEKKFPSAERLVQQIREDVLRAKKFFANDR